MIDEMGIFRTTVSLSSLMDPQRRRQLDDVMVDTGAEYSCIPREVLADLGIEPARVDSFKTVDGRSLNREVGFAMLYAAGRSTPTIVVFGDKEDLTLLGAFGLEGLNVRVDLNLKELVPAGPVQF